MKTTNKVCIAVLALVLLFNVPVFSQGEEAPKRPMYVVITKMHWNMDRENFNNDDWIATEKMFKDNVTKKNEYVMSSGFYTHRFTADNTELLYVQTYASWEDIDKAANRNIELAEQAWPNESERGAFMKDRDNYYANHHSDEIYATMPGAKTSSEKMDKNVIVYMQVRHFANPQDGNYKEFDEGRMEYNENVIQKNEIIKGYYPMEHAWGSDKTQYIEVFVVESLDDLDDMAERNGELFRAHWSDEAKRKEMGERMGKYFTGVHGDYIYESVHELNY